MIADFLLGFVKSIFRTLLGMPTNETFFNYLISVVVKFFASGRLHSGGETREIERAFAATPGRLMRNWRGKTER
jgi:hypothetical protein